MANTLYDKAREDFLSGALSWLTDDLRVILVNTNLYTVNPATDLSLDDLPAGARIAVSSSLSAKTALAGVADAGDALFPSVVGPTIRAIVIYRHTGTESTSRLVAYMDTGLGLPFGPSGTNIVVEWSNSPDRIFKL